MSKNTTPMVNNTPLADIDIKPIEDTIKAIDICFGDLKLSRDKEQINELEYLIYDYCNLISDNRRIYTRNRYIVEKEKDRIFIQKRKEMNSDVATSKVVNAGMREVITFLELQEMMVDRLEDKKEIFTRLANNVNSMRIGDLADAKRAIK